MCARVHNSSRQRELDDELFAGKPAFWWALVAWTGNSRRDTGDGGAAAAARPPIRNYTAHGSAAAMATDAVAFTDAARERTHTHTHAGCE